MKIVCSNSVVGGESLFSVLGALVLVDDKLIHSDVVADADILVTRSQTVINEELLKNSSVKVVATATSGINHIDTDYLEQNNIKYFSAAGCNAKSVVDYVICAMRELNNLDLLFIENKTLGIIGLGHVGQELAKQAEVLGMKVIACDPPRKRQNKRLDVVTLEQILEQSDVVSLHVPLIDKSVDKTKHLVDVEFIKNMKPGSCLINTSRGDVADAGALLWQYQHQHLNAVVLDVWPNEPNIDPALVVGADIATPHIAGYSTVGRYRGTWQVYLQLCRYLDIKPKHSFEQWFASHQFVGNYQQPYDIMKDHLAFTAKTDNLAALFTGLRQNYRLRFETSLQRI